jgi:hypothetical protein
VVSDVAGAPFVILSMMDILLLSLAELFVPSTLERKIVQLAFSEVV